MKVQRAILCILLVMVPGMLAAQITTDVLGAHDLGPGGQSPVRGGAALTCMYCHAPHSGVGGVTPLWNQTLSKQTYTPYTSTTYQNKGNTVPPLGYSSSLCLSCHDGTVAPGQTTVYGNIAMSGSMNSSDVFGADLRGSHPFSLVTPLKDSPDLVASLVASHTTSDPTGKVKLINATVECTSCHNPHVQSIDTVSTNFLVINSTSGQMCLDCHDPTRTVTGQTNPIYGWTAGIHATSTNETPTAAQVGSYGTVAANACLSCHQPHNAPGQARLLRQPTPAITGMDATTQDCLTCHTATSKVTAPDVYTEFQKPMAHLLPSGSNTHDAAEATLLNNNRHATCADCHNPHSAQKVNSFTLPPTMRISQGNATGISASDGTTVLSPAVNQYETCLRCHGTSSGKQELAQYGYFPARVVANGDPLNVIPEFNAAATSSHPVTHDRSSQYVQPSLLSSMLAVDGVTNSRQMGTRIFCTDCHNADDNREFGGSGPNGPHGSKYSHILERRYELSQATTAGSTITNLNVHPSLSTGNTNPGPYALCAKCHDLSTTAGVGILSDASFKPSTTTGAGGHYTHVWDQGISCSACHTPHGMGATLSSISGERLVNFDANVVASNNGTLSYNRSTNSCVLTCHNYAHNSDGTVTAMRSVQLKLKQ